MFSHFSIFGDKRRARPAPSRGLKRRPSLESLEGRQLMSLGLEMVGPINMTTQNAQYDSDNASSGGGFSVVTWTHTFSPTDHDIRAQRLDTQGNKLRPEIFVSSSGLDESAPAVAMDDLGRFVVTWVQKQSNGDTNVLANRYDSNGQLMGSTMQIGAGTFKEHDPDVAMDQLGNFVVSYTRDTNFNNPDVFAKRYNLNGVLLNVFDVGTSGSVEDHSSVAMTADGRIAIAWEQAFTATDHDIKMSRYGPTGAFQGVTGIASSTLNDISPSIGMDDTGRGVVAWEKAGNIMARRFDPFGSLGNEFTIAGTSFRERNASVGMRRGGGGFVVAYEYMPGGATYSRVAEVSPFNSIVTYNTGVRLAPAVSMSLFGEYVMTYTSLDGSDLNIRGRRGLHRPQS